MTDTIYVQYGDAITEFYNNVVSTPPSIGTIIADLLNSRGQTTGVLLRNQGGGTLSIGDRTSGPHHGYPEPFYDGVLFRSAPIHHAIQNLGPWNGLPYLFETSCYGDNALRDVDVTFDSASVFPAPVTERYLGTVTTPNPPVQFTGLVASAEILVDFVSPTADIVYENGFKLVLGHRVNPDQSGVTYGGTLTGGSTLASVTTATLTDAEGNILTLINVQDLGTGDWSADVPAITPALESCLTGTVTLAISDGALEADELITLDPLSGYDLTTLATLGGTPSFTALWATREVGDQIQWNDARVIFYDDERYATIDQTAFSVVTWVTSKTGGEITQVTYNFDGGVIVSAFATGSRNDLLSKIVTAYGGTPSGTNRNELLQNWLDAT